MTVLNTEQHESVEQAIQSLEKDVLGELVVVIAKSSDSYRFIPTLWAALLALVLPGIYLLGQGVLTGGWAEIKDQGSELSSVYIAQVTVFFGFLMLFHWAPVLRFIVPSSVYKERASRLAHEQFLAHRLHHTSKRCGALVFISLLEHHVEIMVDQGLAEQVPNSYWEGTISRLSPLLKNGETAEACHEAIGSVAKMMRQHCPRSASQPKNNELPNHVIEL